MESFEGMDLNVLIVDDEPLLAEETAAGLEFSGLRTIIAGSADEALLVVRSRNDVGVLVTDLRMPGTNGLHLARQALAARDEANALAVVLMTGYSSDIEIQNGIVCVEKPFLVDDLERVVREALKSAAERRQGTR